MVMSPPALLAVGCVSAGTLVAVATSIFSYALKRTHTAPANATPRKVKKSGRNAKRFS
jgi:hypothetical protein